MLCSRRSSSWLSGSLAIVGMLGRSGGEDGAESAVAVAAAAAAAVLVDVDICLCVVVQI